MSKTGSNPPYYLWLWYLQIRKLSCSNPRQITIETAMNQGFFFLLFSDPQRWFEIFHHPSYPDWLVVQ